MQQVAYAAIPLSALTEDDGSLEMSEVEELTEHIQTSLSTKPPEPQQYFVVPPGFRPDLSSVGREREYEEIDRRLFDGRRQRESSTCIFLQGAPGSGKTHLARRYIYGNRNFRGGIFWVDAENWETILTSFREIQKVVLPRETPEDLIELVRAWFRDRDGWLIVFDNVNEDDGMLGLERCVLEKLNSSIISISRGPALAKRDPALARVEYPADIIKINDLGEEQAIELLFKELAINQRTATAMKKAKEVVTVFSGLPLAIKAVGHRVKSRNRVLMEFFMPSPIFKSTPVDMSFRTVLGLEYGRNIDRLRHSNKTEAWNLLHVLCWFEEYLPLKMLLLGISDFQAVPITVTTRKLQLPFVLDQYRQRDICQTVGQLLEGGFIELNPTNEGQKRLKKGSPVIPKSTDQIRVHRVVQGFCRDSIKAENNVHKWLGYAIYIFCCSFDTACRGRKEMPQLGTRREYDLYEAQSYMLSENIQNYHDSDISKECLRKQLDPTQREIYKSKGRFIESRNPDTTYGLQDRYSGILSFFRFDFEDMLRMKTEDDYHSSHKGYHSSHKTRSHRRVLGQGPVGSNQKTVDNRRQLD